MLLLLVPLTNASACTPVFVGLGLVWAGIYNPSSYPSSRPAPDPNRPVLPDAPAAAEADCLRARPRGQRVLRPGRVHGHRGLGGPAVRQQQGGRGSGQGAGGGQRAGEQGGWGSREGGAGRAGQQGGWAGDGEGGAGRSLRLCAACRHTA